MYLTRALIRPGGPAVFGTADSEPAKIAWTAHRSTFPVGLSTVRYTD